MDCLNANALCVFLALVLGSATGGWKTDDKVRLEDVKVLTLQAGKMTTGRRSSPVKQLECVGGSAGCSSFKPQVVQCYNRGSDGIDIQWECKADMDNAYRFGKIEVVCEGYDYPDDPYILKGSCGLEYTLELTKEGYEQQNQGQYQSYGGYNSYDSGYSTKQYKKSNWLGDTVMLVIVGVIIYAVYRTCIGGGDQNTSDWQDGADNTRRQPPPPRSGPPPPGFRDEYMPGYDDGNCHSTRTSGGYTHTRSNHATNNNTGGGFWTGAATGGLLGYLFGSRTNTYSQPYHRPYNRGWGSGWGSGWGTNHGSSWGSGWGSGTRTTFRSGGGGGFGGGSTGTRTASGFGGTRRR